MSCYAMKRSGNAERCYAVSRKKSPQERQNAELQVQVLDIRSEKGRDRMEENVEHSRSCWCGIAWTGYIVVAHVMVPIPCLVSLALVNRMNSMRDSVTVP